MYRVELYAQVRRSVFVEGLSEREAAKRFGLARGTVRKMLRYATPPGYRRRQPAQRPKLDPFTGIVDQILIDDQERPKKQRHTAKRIFDRLRDEYDFTGGYTIVKDYVRDKKLGTGAVTQGHLTASMAQLMAFQAAKEAAEGYEDEIERRETLAERVAAKQQSKLLYDAHIAGLNANRQSLREGMNFPIPH